MDLVFETLFGSHLYGTATLSSDKDYKAVYLPSAEEILLGRYQKSINLSTKQDNDQKNIHSDIDRETFSLDKYLYLLSEGQTVAVDMLFSHGFDTNGVKGKTTTLWDNIYHNRGIILNKKCKSFVGYCRTQANKYGIKGSRVAAVRKVVELLTPLAEITPRLKLGDSILEKEIPAEEHISYLDIETTPGTLIRHIKCCEKMCPYTFTVKEAHRIFKHILDEYGVRAKQAESNEGIDWKALSHAVRIGEQACELLNTGNIVFPRRNADILVKIKTGQVPYKEVAERIEMLLLAVEEASIKSHLPEESDYAFIDWLICKEYGRKVVEKYGRE